MPKQRSDPFNGFQRATVDDYYKPRIIAVSRGEYGSRKTSFWAEGPGPIGVFSLNRGLEGTVDRVLRERPNKEIYVREYEWMPTNNDNAQQEAYDLREQFEADLQQILPHIRTGIMDLETEFWQLYRFADGCLGGDEMRSYDVPNGRMRRIIGWIKDSDANFGFIQRMQDVWGVVTKRGGQTSRGPTGERSGAGFKELPGLVHLELTHAGHGPKTWSITVGKVRGPGNQLLADETFDFGSVPDFQTFAQLVFPETEESDWT